MIQEPHFYAVIIGSEILNRRRDEKHFDFLSKALKDRGFTLFASFIIKDDKELITQTYELVKKDPLAMMFSFGGIGSTPDDLTRKIAAEVFCDGELYRHPQFEKDILTRLGERAYPHSITMSDLPKDARLLFNPINNMSGFFLDERYFFMPGFPEMAQPMIGEILSKYCPQSLPSFSQSLIAEVGESRLTTLMMQLSETIELSSLPMMNDGRPSVELSLSGRDAQEIQKHFKRFTDFLESEAIPYRLL